MGKGRTFELDTRRDMKSAVDERFVWVTVPDYSGVAKGSSGDIAVIYGTHYHGHVHGDFIEMKKRTAEEGHRCNVMSGSAKDECGLDELERLIDGCPNWGEPYVAIKFNNREIIVIHAQDLHDYLMDEELDTFNSAQAERNFHDARLTDAGSISMRKPALSYWESSTAGQDDHLKILEQTGGDQLSFDEPISIEDGSVQRVSA